MSIASSEMLDILVVLSNDPSGALHNADPEVSAAPLGIGWA